MIVEIYITRATIIIIVITTSIMAVNHGEKNVMFVAKKVVALINIKTMSNKKQKTFETKSRVL